jgi:hypothetical protein
MTRKAVGLAVLLFGLLVAAASRQQLASAFTRDACCRCFHHPCTHQQQRRQAACATPSRQDCPTPTAAVLWMVPSHKSNEPFHQDKDDKPPSRRDFHGPPLPRHLQYAKLWQSLQDSLETARAALSEAQSLNGWLQSMEALDPDLASAAALVHAELLSYKVQEDDSDDQQPERFGSTTTTSTMVRRRRRAQHHHNYHYRYSDPLLQAVEYAVVCCDRLGRFSPAAAQAWSRVDMVLQQQGPDRQLVRKRYPFDMEQPKHNLALLSHPSYRYSYATNVVLRSRRREHNDAPKPHPSQSLRSSYTTTTSTTLQKQGLDQSVATLSSLQDLASREIHRLREADFERALRLRTWNVLWYRES